MPVVDPAEIFGFEWIFFITDTYLDVVKKFCNLSYDNIIPAGIFFKPLRINI